VMMFDGHPKKALETYEALVAAQSAGAEPGSLVDTAAHR
jgi:hypothetical protein